MPTTAQPNTRSDASSSIGTTIPFDSLQEPGCYICNWSGHLLRVPEDGVARGRSPLVSMIGIEPLFFDPVAYDPESRTYRISSDGAKLESISGTQVRKTLRDGEALPNWFMREVIQDMIRSEIAAGRPVFQE